MYSFRFSFFIPLGRSHSRLHQTLLQPLKSSTLLLARLMGQYCFAHWRLSSVVVCNTAGRRVGRPPGARAVGRPTLHGGPVVLRSVKATPCNILWCWLNQIVGLQRTVRQTSRHSSTASLRCLHSSLVFCWRGKSSTPRPGRLPATLTSQRSYTAISTLNI